MIYSVYMLSKFKISVLSISVFPLVLIFQNCGEMSASRAALEDNFSVNSPDTDSDLTSDNAGGMSLSGCDCDSSQSDSPCMGNSVSYTRGRPDLPSSTIEFRFQCDGGACACGKFANRYDYWVAPLVAGGGVEIVGMSPAATGAADASLRSGWVANPSATLNSTFMDGRLGDMTYTGQPLNPDTSTPLAINTAQVPVTTLVKSHSLLETGSTSCGGADTTTGISRHCFWQAGVLNVLHQVPPNAGTTILRPPLTGKEKPLHSVSLIDFSALPNLAYPARNDGTVVTGKTWEVALDLMAPPKVEWGATGNWPYWQYMPPMYNFSMHKSGYPPRTMSDLLDSMQLLAIDGAGHEAQKRLLTIRSVQWGLDYYYMWKANGYGALYKPNGGHAVGRYLPTVIAAALMGGSLGTEMKSDMLRVNNGTGDKCGFDIPGELFHWSDTGRVLYGYFNIEGCGTYNNYTRQTNSNYVDPNHIGDNGRLEVNKDNDEADVNSCSGAYQSITVGPTQTTANLIRAIPAARDIAYDHMLTYINRMYDNGYYCSEDHLPAEKYVSAFGRCDGGTNAGEQCRNKSDCGGSACIGNRNQYTSWMARNMWEKYKDCYDTKSCSGMEGL